LIVFVFDGEHEGRVSYPAKAGEEDPAQQLLESSGDSKKDSIWLITSHPLMASIAVYCLWSLQDIAYTEVCTFHNLSQLDY
jgi:hypothetical protein